MAQPLNIIQPSWKIADWLKVWWSAIISPRISTYIGLAENINANLALACLWWALGMLLSNVTGFILVAVLGGRLKSPLLISSTNWAQLLWVVILSPLLLLFMTGVIHSAARLLGGQGRYQQLAYVLAACSFPLMVIVMPLFSVIRGTWFAILAYGYWMFLYVVATKAVYRFSWIRTIVTLVITFAVGEACFIGYFLFLFSLRK